MSPRLAADLLVLVHLAFIVFVVCGGLLVLRWRRAALLHLPAVLWGVWIEFSGGICPLTPLEQNLRRQAGDAGYGGSFVEHYLIPVIYPGELTRPLQLFLGLLVIAVNLGVYGWLARRLRNRPCPKA
ncbi:MAG: DUF2784 domain-containing protein [Deltaproteobacteria bacterium]|nr:MAG: DUF2784 domain-containing protein [Deltaproteobacteria bacterium]